MTGTDPGPLGWCVVHAVGMLSCHVDSVVVRTIIPRASMRASSPHFLPVWWQAFVDECCKARLVGK